MNIPKQVERIYNPFDWYGWIVCTITLLLMCKFGGVGWKFGNDSNWWLFALSFIIFWENAMRVAFGKINKYVYYDTVVHSMFELEIQNKKFFVCAETEEELDMYLDLHYPNIEYAIINKTHTESFIKSEEFN